MGSQQSKASSGGQRTCNSVGNDVYSHIGQEMTSHNLVCKTCPNWGNQVIGDILMSST